MDAFTEWSTALWRAVILYGLFSLLILTGSAVLLGALIGLVSLSSTDRVALFCGLLASGIVWWQGHLLARQLAYGAVLDLYREWNSVEMLHVRRNAWDREKECASRETIEDVLEFLEKVSTLWRNGYIGQKFVWDTFGWYVGRYYFYCRSEIDFCRTKWTHKPDPTLYQDLQAFYHRLLAVEARERRVPEREVEDEYQRTRKMFILSEIGFDES